MGDSTQLLVAGPGVIQVEDAFLQDVLVVLDISTNLLSVYQICHFGTRKTLEFTPHDVVIRDLHDPNVIMAIRSVDPTSWLYHFDGFESPTLVGSSFITHAD